MKKKNPRRQKSAISLRYDSSRDMAPKVTSKGKGLAAENIITLAKKHNIPVKEDPDLVEALSQVEVDREIPAALYHVVAELLAFIYQLNKDYSDAAPSENSH